jgi:hypothetical protein
MHYKEQALTYLQASRSTASIMARLSESQATRSGTANNTSRLVKGNV